MTATGLVAVVSALSSRISPLNALPLFVSERVRKLMTWVRKFMLSAFASALIHIGTSIRTEAIPHSENTHVHDAEDELARVASDSLGNSVAMIAGKAFPILSDGAATHTITPHKDWLMPDSIGPSEVGILASCEEGGGIIAEVQGMPPTIFSTLLSRIYKRQK